jgi:hypothetical protein
MTKHINNQRSLGQRVARLGVVAVALTLPLAGCENILEVTDPDIVTPDNLLDEIGLQTLRNGVIGEFNLAYSGGGSTDGMIMTSGLFTDEWMHSGTFTTRFQAETRSIPDDNGTLEGMFRRLQRARNSAEEAARKIGDSPGGATDERVPEMLMYAGFTYLAFAENYCNGVPFSLQPETGDTEFGAPETGSQIFDRAIAAFQAALAHGAVAADIADASRVGVGRAMVGKGDYAGASAAVAGVASDFVKWTRHSNNSGNERNQIYEFNVSVGRWSLGDTEGVNGLDFRTAGDPRIQSALCPGCAFDTSEQVPGTPSVGDNWQFTNYVSRENPVRLAAGVEARLIEAEALLGSNPAGWLAAMNAIRADWATHAVALRGDAAGTLAPLVDPGTQAAREDLHFRERAFWNFSTGQRLADLRRLVRQYGRNSDTVYPIGPYWKPGANYGVDLNIIVPLDEENNPNFTGCLDRQA